jgi:hypothetical protein
MVAAGDIVIFFAGEESVEEGNSFEFIVFDLFDYFVFKGDGELG